MKPLRIRTSLTVLLLTALLAAGCAAHRVREAQDMFSRAATMENRLRDRATVADAPDLGMVDQAAVLNDYKVALSLINDSLGNARQQLIQDDLYGTAYMLKAMCLWRIADLENNTKAVDALDRVLGEIKALHSSGDKQRFTLGTRDQVILEALPGFLDHDRGLRAQTREEADRYFRSAFHVLESALEKIRPPPHHPVIVYIRLSQLSVCRAWQAKLFELLAPQEARSASQEARTGFKEVLNKLRPYWKSDEKLKSVLERFNQQIQAQYNFD